MAGRTVSALHPRPIFLAVLAQGKQVVAESVHETVSGSCHWEI